MSKLDLSKIPLFGSLPPDEIEHLTEVLKTLTLDPGMVLCKEGDPGDKFYVITAGQLEIIKSLGTPDEQILGIRNQGDFLGEMSLLVPDGLRTASVRANSVVELMELSYADFDTLLKKLPSLAMEMVRELSIRLRHSDNVMIRDLTQKNLELAQAYQDLHEAQAQYVEK